MRLTIDTATDSYEQALAAIQAAYGVPTTGPAAGPETPPVDDRPGPQDLDTTDLGDGWSEQSLFAVVAGSMPGARAVLRRVIERGGTAPYDEVPQYFADHPTNPIPLPQMVGTLTSIKAVQRRLGAATSIPLLQRDDYKRHYQIEQPLRKGLLRAFALADARPDLLRVKTSRSHAAPS
ncbi:hypothetical protein [Streptomyces sp. NPDC058202]|uniref:hypothetical protein n=1 Tax=Streptomyces sp. NPDC058202 TaxID=3346380 RepID=UPI0036E9A504